MNYTIPKLPLSIDLETKKVLKKVIEARAALAELNGSHSAIPNVGVLLNTLALQEAKDSSAVENIRV
jgi:Fic family protein